MKLGLSTIQVELAEREKAIRLLTDTNAEQATLADRLAEKVYHATGCSHRHMLQNLSVYDYPWWESNGVSGSCYVKPGNLTATVERSHKKNLNKCVFLLQEASIASLQSEVTQLTEKCSHLQLSKEDLQQQISLAKEGLSEVRAECDELQTGLREKEGDLTRLQKECDDGKAVSESVKQLFPATYLFA